MKQLYLDNASTTFPKPKVVADAVYHYMTENGTNINRGCYSTAIDTEEAIYDTRERLCRLFHGSDSRNVVFTKNVTESLNILLKGFLKPGDHVLVSSMEHNAVMRPLNQLAEHGITFTRIPCRADGSLILDSMKDCLRTNTRLVVMTHASNVCGTILPIEEVGQFCQEQNLTFFVDCAQTAGTLPIDMQAMHIDALAFTGHKGLLGPQGIGGFLLREGLSGKITPLLSGGTGSISHTEEIPSFMPDRFEAGTMNLPGILGLQAALSWLEETGLETIRFHEVRLADAFIRELLPLEQDGFIRICGIRPEENNSISRVGRTGVVSIQTRNMDLSEAAYLLDDRYGIQTRVGLHCAPNAHKVLGTYPTGTIRFSFGFCNTMEQVHFAVNALEEICHGL